MANMDIGSCIREIRIAEELSSIELSEMVGIDATTLTKIETGKIRNPAFDTVFRLVEILSKTPTVQQNKVDFTKYDSSVAKMFKAFINMPAIEARYNSTILEQKLNNLSDNINYISAEELQVINIFSLGKKFIVDTLKSARRLDESIEKLISDKVINSSEEVDFSKLILLLLENDEKFRDRINTLLYSIVTNQSTKDIIDFLPVFLDSLSTKEAVLQLTKLVDGSIERDREMNKQLRELNKKSQYNYLD